MIVQVLGPATHRGNPQRVLGSCLWHESEMHVAGLSLCLSMCVCVYPTVILSRKQKKILKSLLHFSYTTSLARRTWFKWLWLKVSASNNSTEASKLKALLPKTFFTHIYVYWLPTKFSPQNLKYSTRVTYSYIVQYLF